MKKLIITEQQSLILKRSIYTIESYFADDVIINENDFTNFSIEQLKEINTFKGRVEYCTKFLKRLGAGSTRIVYELPNGDALKLAKNKIGLAQCEAEVETFSEGNPILANVKDYDEIEHNVVFVIMERVKKASVKDFRRILNVNFKVFNEAETYSIDTVHRKKDYRNQHEYFLKYLNGYAQAHKNEKFLEFVKNLYSYIMDNDIVMFGDVTRIVNWGITNNERLVLLDYGLNDQVYSTHYR